MVHQTLVAGAFGFDAVFGQLALTVGQRLWAWFGD